MIDIRDIYKKMIFKIEDYLERCEECEDVTDTMYYKDFDMRLCSKCAIRYDRKRHMN